MSGTNPKPEIEEIEDARSPDGKRVILRGQAWQDQRAALCQLASSCCEGCDTAHSLPLSRGDAHHLYGKGAGKRDDRIWIPLPSGESRRNLVWTCRVGHDAIHAVGIRKWREQRYGRG